MTHTDKQPQTVYEKERYPTSYELTEMRGAEKHESYLRKIENVLLYTPEELEARDKKIIWDTLYDPCENCGAGHIRPCNHCGDLGYNRKMFDLKELEALIHERERKAAEKALFFGHIIGFTKYSWGSRFVKSEIETYLKTHYPLPQTDSK